MTEDERDTFEKAQLDLVREGRKAEREKIVRWLRSLDTELKVPMTLANWIEEGMHNS